MLTSIPGKFSRYSGLNVAPSPRPSETAIIIRLRFDNFTLPRVLIPEAATIPNIMIPAPPKTGSGIIAISVATFGNSPRKKRIIPATVTTCLLATLVRGISPTFWLNEVLAPDPKNPAIKLPTPSAKSPFATLSCEFSTSHASSTAISTPTVSIVVTR